VALGTAGTLMGARGQPGPLIDLGTHTPAQYLERRAEGVMPMINSSVVFRRDVFVRLGGYRAEYTPTEDTDLWTRLAREGVVLNLPEPLTRYRLHDTNVSGRHFVRMMTHIERIRENSRRLDRHEPELDEAQFGTLLKADPARHRELTSRLRQDALIQRARSAWYNGRRARGLALRLVAAAVYPTRTLAQLRGRLGRRTTPGAR
jgi:hypothetical protein